MKRILVVCLDNLGDLVFASALIPPLCERFPTARIGVWCKSYTRGLLPLIPNLSDVYAADPFWDRSPGAGKGSVRKFISTVADVSRSHFDSAILFSAPWRAAAALALARVPQRVGLERRKNRRWLTHTLTAEDKTKPVLEELARLLEPFGIHAKRLTYRLDASGLMKERDVVVKAIGSQPYVALHPFAGSESRCVNLSEWLDVARNFSSQGLRVFWIGTPTELARIPDADKNWVRSDQISDGSLTTTCAAIAGARLFVGHDSGPMHIAAALSVPTLGVFAPGEPLRTFPQGPGDWRIISTATPREVNSRMILDKASELLRRD